MLQGDTALARGMLLCAMPPAEGEGEVVAVGAAAGSEVVGSGREVEMMEMVPPQKVKGLTLISFGQEGSTRDRDNVAKKHLQHKIPASVDGPRTNLTAPSPTLEMRTDGFRCNNGACVCHLMCAQLLPHVACSLDEATLMKRAHCVHLTTLCLQATGGSGWARH